MRATPSSSRRAFLGLLAGAAGSLVLFAPRFVIARPVEPPADRLCRRDRLVASLGRCVDPAEARRLRRTAEALLPVWATLLPRARRARLARERLLARKRLDAELARGEVVRVDGWLLARSEAALAVYLGSLTRRQPAMS